MDTRPFWTEIYKMTDIITITDMARLPKNTKFIDHGVFLGMTLEDAIKKYKEMYGEEPPAVYHVTRIYIPANGNQSENGG